MLSKVAKAIEKYGMFESSKEVTVALSGGADSVCLLLALRELSEKYRLELSAVHINHQLRGDESNRDEDFVRALCKELSVPLEVRRVDVGRIAEENGESVELAARNIRYDIFKELSSGAVATAHTADDNLETVIYNMTRGSGLRGLCGIPPKRDIFIRPLILCSRKEVEAFLLSKGGSFVTDSSNLTDDYTRNFLRHNAVPLIKSINPSAEQTVAAMCEGLREDEEFISSTARKIYTLCLRDGFLDAELLRLQPPSILKRAVALFLSEEHGLKTDALHLERCREIIMGSGRTSMSGVMTAVCQGKRFYLVSDDKNDDDSSSFSVAMKEIAIDNFSKINNLFLKNAIDCDKINGRLEVRTRRAADEIELFGRGCTKTLKKLMNEQKIPTGLREKLPVAADDDGVVWIYGIGVSQRAAVDKNTKKAIQFITNNK